MWSASSASEVEAIGGDELLFPGQRTRGYPIFRDPHARNEIVRVDFLGAGRSCSRGSAVREYEAPRSTAWRAATVGSTFWNGLTAGIRL